MNPVSVLAVKCVGRALLTIRVIIFFNPLLSCLSLIIIIKEACIFLRLFLEIYCVLYLEIYAGEVSLVFLIGLICQKVTFKSFDFSCGNPICGEYRLHRSMIQVSRVYDHDIQYRLRPKYPLRLP